MRKRIHITQFIILLGFLVLGKMASTQTNMEQMALFPGCEEMESVFQANCTNEKLFEFIVANMIYPTHAIEERIQGTVIVQYTINSEGNVENIKVIQSVDKVLDDEAVRIVKLLPTHSPAQLHGRSTTMTFNVPMMFQLFEAEE